MFQGCRGKSGYFEVIEFKVMQDLVKKIIPSVAGDTLIHVVSIWGKIWIFDHFLSHSASVLLRLKSGRVILILVLLKMGRSLLNNI